MANEMANEMANSTYLAHETLTGAGIEVWLGYGANAAIHYTLRGQGIAPEASIWIGSRGDLLHMLLGPLGCVERNGVIVTNA